MSSLELILSESEWKNLLAFRGYAKQVFDVDINAKDEFYGGGCTEVESRRPSSSSAAKLPATQQNRDSQNSNHDNVGIGIFTRNVSVDGECVVRPPPVIVQIQTKNAPSNLEQCRKFAIACSPSNPDFKLITVQLTDPHSLDMVKAQLAGIQQSTATLINLYPGSSDITIQGHHSCVDLAQRHIHTILHDLKSKSFETHNQIQQPNFNSNFSPSSPPINNNNALLLDNNSDISICNPPNFLSEKNLSPQTTNSIITSPNKSDDGVFFSDHGNHSIQSYQDVFNLSTLSAIVNEENESPVHSPAIVSNPPPFQSYTESQQQPAIIHHQDSESDAEEDNILADARFRERIEQATKLGFSDELVVKVLKRLGVNSSMEDMMQELVKEPQEPIEEDESTLRMEELKHSLTNEEDSDDSEGFDVDESSNLRHIIIDGSNVAMSHGQRVFSCMGIKIVVDWFKNRGHKNITAFVPQWRKEASRPDAPITNQEILTELEAERIVVFTPSRRVGGTRIVCYDDRYVLQLAVQNNGIVVSNDVYRDLVRERDDFRQVVEKRLLMYSFVKDTFMPPEDPLGRQGPSLDNFLRIKPSEPKNKPENCPYGKKCTFGNKCRFYHPERRYAPMKMVAEKLKENAELKLKSAKAGISSDNGRQPKQKLSRTVSLVPQGSSAKSDNVTVVNQSKKPTLHHSKSLVYSNSYLTDLRLKMEEAESADAIPVLSSDTLHPQQHSLEQKQQIVIDQKVESKSIKKQYSNSCSPSPRTSPTPNPEIIKTKVKPVKSYPSSPLPNFSPIITVPNVKSSLNIPNPDPQDRYLSGHLLVAKRLSDEENNSGNFFSQHTSRTPGSSHQESNILPLDGHLLSSDSNTSPVQLMPTVTMQEIYLPPGMQTQTGLNIVSRENSPVSSTCLVLPKEIEDDSGIILARSTDQRSEQYDSCPTFSRKEYELPQHRQFQRSISSTSQPHLSEFSNTARHGHRKFSLNTINTKPVENLHNKNRPHSTSPSIQGIPYNQHYTNTHPFQPQFQRNKSSFDSGISSGGLSVDQHLNTNSVFSPTENSSVFSFSNAPNMSGPPPVISPAMQNPVRQIMHQQQEVMYQSSPSSFIPPSPHHYSPLPNRMAFGPTQPHSYLDQNQMNVLQNPISPTMPITHRPPPYVTPPFATAAATTTTTTHYMNSNQPQLQSMSFYPPSMSKLDNQFYPMPVHSTSSGSAMHQYNPHTPTSPFPQQQPTLGYKTQANVCDEEALISVEDPRYPIYYNLSPVFGERVVRTFMNRNPDVRNINQLHSLISAYKLDMGL